MVFDEVHANRIWMESKLASFSPICPQIFCWCWLSQQDPFSNVFSTSRDLVSRRYLVFGPKVRFAVLTLQDLLFLPTGKLSIPLKTLGPMISETGMTFLHRRLSLRTRDHVSYSPSVFSRAIITPTDKSFLHSALFKLLITIRHWDRICEWIACYWRRRRRASDSVSACLPSAHFIHLVEDK
jgi:hypothetical protein